MEVYFVSKNGSFPTYGIRKDVGYDEYILARRQWYNIESHAASVDELVELFAARYGDDNIDLETDNSTKDSERERLRALYNKVIEYKTVSVESDEISNLI